MTTGVCRNPFIHVQRMEDLDQFAGSQVVYSHNPDLLSEKGLPQDMDFAFLSVKMDCSTKDSSTPSEIGHFLYRYTLENYLPLTPTTIKTANLFMRVLSSEDSASLRDQANITALKFLRDSYPVVEQELKKTKENAQSRKMKQPECEGQTEKHLEVVKKWAAEVYDITKLLLEQQPPTKESGT